jgi:hypothetical protein
MINQKTLFAALALLLSIVQLAAQTPSKQEETPPPNNEKEFEQQYQERIKKDRLNGVYIPKNLDDACAQLDKLITDESKAKYKALPEDSVVTVMHHRLGRWIIMNWGFYGGSRLSHYLRSAGVTFPEDMADFLLLVYHRHLNGKPNNIKELVVRFRETRKKDWEKEKKEGKVLSETKRKVKPEEVEKKKKN